MLIDPPYEIKNDYDTVVNTLVKAHKRLQLERTYLVSGCNRERIDRMEAGLIASGMRNIQLSSLQQRQTPTFTV